MQVDKIREKSSIECVCKLAQYCTNRENRPKMERKEKIRGPGNHHAIMPPKANEVGHVERK